MPHPPAARAIPVRETQIVRAILDFLALYPHEIWARRQNTGGMYDRLGRFVRFGVPGQADISGILRGGRRLEIEVKRPGGRQTPEQIAFGETIKRMGGLYVVARGIEDVRRALRDAGVWRGSMDPQDRMLGRISR